MTVIPVTAGQPCPPSDSISIKSNSRECASILHEVVTLQWIKMIQQLAAGLAKNKDNSLSNRNKFCFLKLLEPRSSGPSGLPDISATALFGHQLRSNAQEQGTPGSLIQPARVKNDL